MLSPEEIDYLHSQHVARIASVGADGQVDVSPVGFSFDGAAFYIGSSRMDRTLKGQNVAAGRTLVALVVDDLPSTEPYAPRGIKIHGVADLVEREGRGHFGGRTTFIRVRPTRSWSFGILAPGFQDGRWTTTRLKWPDPEADRTDPA